MSKVNFNIDVVDLDGKVVETDGGRLNIGKTLANLLSLAKPVKSAIGQLNLALKIYNANNEITLEDDDIVVVKKVVEQSNLSTLVASQILKLLE